MFFKFCLCFLYIHLVSADNKIVSGNKAKLGEFPFAVCIFDTQKCFCTGTLAGVKRIITAAHCFKYYSGNGKSDDDPLQEFPYTRFSALVGVVNIDSPEGKKYGLEKVTYHSKTKYRRSRPIIYDLAVASLVKEVETNANVQVMKIPTGDKEGYFKAWEDLKKNKKTCISMGWGQSNEDDPRSTTRDLMTVETAPMDGHECLRKYGGDDLAPYGFVCVKAVKQGQGTCGGDSGSPIFCNGFVFGTFSGTAGACVDGIGYYYTYADSLDEFDLKGVAGGNQIGPELLLFIFVFLQAKTSFKTKC